MDRSTRKPASTATCRETLLDLVLAGEVPNERNVEMLLDRLDRETPPEPDNRT